MARKRKNAAKTAATAEQVIAAIKGTGGVKTTIAKRLNVTRQTVDNYLNRWVSVRDAYIEEKAGVDDAALSVVMSDIVNGRNVETAKWWIARKLDEFNPEQKHRMMTWQDEIIEALQRGEIKPEQVRAAYPDLAADFFRRAGVDAGD